MKLLSLLIFALAAPLMADAPTYGTIVIDGNKVKIYEGASKNSKVAGYATDGEEFVLRAEKTFKGFYKIEYDGHICFVGEGDAVFNPPRKPTARPTVAPVKTSIKTPTAVPTVVPEEEATAVPTKAPSRMPTAVPEEEPTALPTKAPTKAPTAAPTPEPVEEATAVPTKAATRIPTAPPTAEPTPQPVEEATAVPTRVPTRVATAGPTEIPTAIPTAVPTRVPTSVPTAIPTQERRIEPTARPTAVPTATQAPTPEPAAGPVRAKGRAKQQRNVQQRSSGTIGGSRIQTQRSNIHSGAAAVGAMSANLPKRDPNKLSSIVFTLPVGAGKPYEVRPAFKPDLATMDTRNIDSSGFAGLGMEGRFYSFLRIFGDWTAYSHSTRAAAQAATATAVDVPNLSSLLSDTDIRYTMDTHGFRLGLKLGLPVVRWMEPWVGGGAGLYGWKMEYRDQANTMSYGEDQGWEFSWTALAGIDFNFNAGGLLFRVTPFGEYGAPVVHPTVTDIAGTGRTWHDNYGTAVMVPRRLGLMFGVGY